MFAQKKLKKRCGGANCNNPDYIIGAPYGVFVTDERGRYLQVNPARCRITGFTVEELLEMGISDMYFPGNVEEGFYHFQAVNLQGKAQEELVFRPKNGERRWWSVTAVKISETRFPVYCSDITK